MMKPIISKKIHFVLLIIIAFTLMGCLDQNNTQSTIRLSETAITIRVGELYLIEPIVEPKLSAVYYWSSDEKIVHVNEGGVVEGLRTGSAIITVELINKAFATLHVNVVWDQANIPDMMIDSFYQPITSKEEYIRGTISVTETTDFPSILLPETSIQIRGRGNSSWTMPKKPYRIKFDKRTSLLGMKEAKDYVLLAEYSDKSLIRNYLAQFLASKLDGIEMKLETRFVSLYLNNIYQGLYLLTEQVEVDKNRVNIDETNDGESFLVELDMRLIEQPSGGYGVDWFIVSNIPYAIQYPKANKEGFLQEAFDNIVNYLNLVDQAIVSFDYHELIDVENFVDYFIIQELFKNVDCWYSSVFIYKDREGRLKMGPLWDFDLSIGNVNYIDYQPIGWYGLRPEKNRWFHYLMQDEFFYNKFKNRFIEIYHSILPSLYEEVLRIGSIIRNHANRNFKTWKILNQYVWPNPIELVNANTHEAQVNYIYHYLSERATWIYQELNQ